MSDLPAWESVKKCKKCGTLRMSYDHVPDMLDLVMTEFKYEYIPAGDYDVEEHMEVICPRCGHGWDERPADAGTGPGG